MAGKPGRSGRRPGELTHDQIERRKFNEFFRNHVNDVLKPAVLESVKEGLAELAIDVKNEAADGLTRAYTQAVSDEKHTLNAKVFPSTDPGEILRGQPVLMEKSTWYRKNPKIVVYAVDKSELDKHDRKMGLMKINVLIKSNRGDLVVNGERCAVKEIAIRSRGNKKSRSDPVTKMPWKLWRVLEYGDVSHGRTAKLGRVFARQVTNVSKSEDGSGDNVSYGGWVVFMTARPYWWKRVASKSLGNIIVEPSSKVYFGGSRPIMNAALKLSDSAIGRKIEERLRGRL